MILFRSIVGSTSKLGIKTSDLDLRGVYVDENIFNPIKPAKKFEWRDKKNNVDEDLIELCYWCRQIIKGHNSCPVFYSCLYSPIYDATELGQELINNRHQFMSSNLIKGTLNFCDRKAKSKGKHKKSKYLYYACFSF